MHRQTMRQISCKALRQIGWEVAISSVSLCKFNHFWDFDEALTVLKRLLRIICLFTYLRKCEKTATLENSN